MAVAGPAAPHVPQAPAAECNDREVIVGFTKEFLEQAKRADQFPLLQKYIADLEMFSGTKGIEQFRAFFESYALKKGKIGSCKYPTGIESLDRYSILVGKGAELLYDARTKGSGDLRKLEQERDAAVAALQALERSTAPGVLGIGPALSAEDADKLTKRLKEVSDELKATQTDLATRDKELADQKAETNKQVAIVATSAAAEQAARDAEIATRAQLGVSNAELASRQLKIDALTTERDQARNDLRNTLVELNTAQQQVTDLTARGAAEKIASDDARAILARERDDALRDLAAEKIQTAKLRDGNLRLAAEKRTEALEKELSDYRGKWTVRSADALEVAHVLSSSSARKAGDEQQQPTFSKSQLEVLRGAIEVAVKDLDRRNELALREMETLLSRGGTDARALNSRRSALVVDNGGRLDRTNADGSMTWSFSVPEDALYVSAALRRVGFTVYTDIPPLPTYEAEAGSIAEALRRASEPRRETFLTTSSFSSEPTTTTTTAAYPAGSSSEWLVDRAISILAKNRRSEAARQISGLLASFGKAEQQLAVDKIVLVFSAGPGLEKRMTDIAMVLRRIGLKHARDSANKISIPLAD